LSAMRRNLGAKSESDPWAPAGSEHDTTGRMQTGTQAHRVAEREVKASRRRKGVKARPNTCSTSPRSIRAAQRRAEALDLRVQGYTFEVIGKHLGVSKAQAARDIDTALAEITREPAKLLMGGTFHLFQPAALVEAHYRCKSSRYPEPGLSRPW
jgi:endonuclease/exonuclease/phosphatase family metal-dependent hydrolase